MDPNPRQSVDVLRSWIERVEREAEVAVLKENEEPNPWGKSFDVMKFLGEPQWVCPEKVSAKKKKKPTRVPLVEEPRDDRPVALSIEELPRPPPPMPMPYEMEHPTPMPPVPCPTMLLSDKVVFLEWVRVTREAKHQRRAEAFFLKRIRRRLQRMLRAWGAEAAASAMARTDAEYHVDQLLFDKYAGRSLRAWSTVVKQRRGKIETFLKRQRRSRLKAVYRVWKWKAVAGQRRAALASAHARAQLERCVFHAWRRRTTAGIADREAQRAEQTLLAAKRNLENAAAWHARRVRSHIFVHWLQYAAQCRDARVFQEKHAARRQKVQALEIALRKQQQEQLQKQPQQEQKQDDREMKRSDHPKPRSTTPVKAHHKTPPPPTKKTRSSPVKTTPGREDRRREIAERTEARLQARRLEREAIVLRREEDEVAKVRDAKMAVVRAQAQAAAMRELARQQWTVARLFAKRSLVRAYGIGPWKALVERSKQQEVTARRWHDDGLVQRIWTAWLAERERRRRQKLEARQTALIEAVDVVRAAQTRRPFAKWLSVIADGAVRAVAVEAKRAQRLRRLYLATWLARTGTAKRRSDTNWERATEFAATLIKRHAIKSWRRAQDLWRHEKNLDSRRQRTWAHVRDWLRD